GECAEQRLQERRADAREQEQGSCRRVAVAAVAHHERNQRRNRALGEIDAQVTEGEDTEAAAIEPARRRRGDGAHCTPRLTGYDPSTCSSALRSDTSLSARSTRVAERCPTTSM